MTWLGVVAAGNALAESAIPHDTPTRGLGAGFLISGFDPATSALVYAISSGPIAKWLKQRVGGS